MSSHHKPHHRVRVVSTLIAAVALGISGISTVTAQATSTGETGQTTGSPSILYAASATKARLLESGSSMILRLPARASVTWFTDRPQRQAGGTDLAQVAATWAAVGFDTDPPNAALVLVDRKGRERTHVVTLGVPRLSGNRVDIAITLVDGGTEAGYAQIHGLRKGRYESARMFIDDAANPPCPAVVTTALNCIMTEQAVSFRSMSGVGTIDACGLGTQGDTQWQAQATLVTTGGGGIMHDSPLFANGQQIPGCDTPMGIFATVFPSESAVTYTEVKVTNQSFTAGESTMGPGGVPSNPSWSPILLTYTIADE